MSDLCIMHVCIFQAVGGITGYLVYYNETMMNVTSPITTTLTFTAPSLPDDEFFGNITVNVTAVNGTRKGRPSDPATEEYTGNNVASL